MSIWEAIIQGIIQGLTEFLPVSSSGHVSIAQHFLGVSGEGAQTFTMFLHFGTLIAVFIVYRKIIWDLIEEFFSMVRDLYSDIVARIKNGKGNYEKSFNWNLNEMNELRRMVCFIVIACACAFSLFIPIFSVLGLTFPDGEKVKTFADLSEYTSEDADIAVEGLCLIATGLLLVYATKAAKRRKYAKQEGGLTLRSTLAMGFGQSIAALPGLSRSGTTTTLGMLAGTEKNKALEFSFIIGIPAVLAINVLEAICMTDEEWNEIRLAPVLVGIFFAAVVGIGAIAALRWVVTNDKLHYFGYYCLAAGAVVVVIAIIESATGCAGGADAADMLAQTSYSDILASASDAVSSAADAVSSSCAA